MIFDGAVVVALGGVGIAAAAVGVRIFRVEADRLVEILDGAVVVALAEVDLAATFIGKRILWIEADRLVQILDGAIGVALRMVRTAARVIGTHGFRIEADRLIVIPDGAVVIAPAVGITAIDIGVDAACLTLRRAARQHRRASGNLAILIGGLTAILPRLVRRTGRQREHRQEHQRQQKATPEHLISIQNAQVKPARRLLSSRRGSPRRSMASIARNENEPARAIAQGRLIYVRKAPEADEALALALWSTAR